MTTYKGFSTYNRFKKFRLTDYDLAKQDLFNHFHIRKGEKLMNPEFGTIIWDMIFEPFDENVKDLIKSDIETIAGYDPRFTLGEVVVSEYEHGIRIQLELVYRSTDFREVMYLNFNKNTFEVSGI
jgi:phage baseplate assembly protein W